METKIAQNSECETWTDKSDRVVVADSIKNVKGITEKLIDALILKGVITQDDIK